MQTIAFEIVSFPNEVCQKPYQLILEQCEILSIECPLTVSVGTSFQMKITVKSDHRFPNISRLRLRCLTHATDGSTDEAQIEEPWLENGQTTHIITGILNKTGEWTIEAYVELVDTVRWGSIGNAACASQTIYADIALKATYT